MPATSGTPRGRALAAALREARTSRQIGLRDLARRIRISHTLVSQWEHGHRVPKTEDVSAVLTGLGVDARERERIIELARNAGENDWLTSGLPGMSQQMAGMLECEREASTIVDWSPLLVPGLLQTSDYARAILGAGGVPREQVEPRVLFRSGRRDILSKNPPVQLRALIGEGALRVRVGGDAVLADQLRYLLKTAENWENVTVQIVRNDVPWHPGTAGPFVLYEFESSPPIVLLEHHRSSVFLHNEDDLVEYRSAADSLREEVAMGPEASAELIADVIRALETTG
ncbi:helix-turn-helix protein [Halopolyspora algeriensis]|uniref:Helix-turn-helix protein n=1 Tax=Halopolyspora algeriensis TaxID=1500506 RepID=A0A368VZT9_9ACTN|nr:helix-turn-helix transcriptional regulator [Halopolyspora algeriensis]RCW45851.1 helix-turn-helix protein [Halopolyspora algeriensis]TQM55266.1 helix-turn-helix protein [Halopolyspora algeriensis]